MVASLPGHPQQREFCRRPRRDQAAILTKRRPRGSPWSKRCLATARRGATTSRPFGESGPPSRRPAGHGRRSRRACLRPLHLGERGCQIARRRAQVPSWSPFERDLAGFEFQPPRRLVRIAVVPRSPPLHGKLTTIWRPDHKFWRVRTRRKPRQPAKPASPHAGDLASRLGCLETRPDHPDRAGTPHLGVPAPLPAQARRATCHPACHPLKEKSTGANRG